MTERGAPRMREATDADAPRIASLFTDEGFPVGESDVSARLARFAQPGSSVIVADVEGDVVGFIAMHLVPRFEHDQPIVRIVALVVDPGVRERGLGHRLMAAAEEFARQHGAAFIEVTAGHHRSEARRLYESLGYDSSVTTYLRKRLAAA